MENAGRILLVEDDELDVISVKRSLSKLDTKYELFTAYNGIEALDMLQGRNGKPPLRPLPELVLLDINMPKMNGIEFLRVLRNDEALKNMKVFVMTTSAQEADRRAMQDLGVSEYLIKPLNFTNNDKRTDSMDAFMQFHIRKLLTKKTA